MSSGMFCLFSLISLLVIPGIFSQEWKVQYTNLEKCVLKGSTTRFSGTFNHPSRLTVTEIFWVVNPNKSTSINLLDRSDYKDRVQYFTIKDQTFDLKLSNVRQEDKGMYCLRIVTNEAKERFQGYPGIQLTVTELRVEIPEEVVEKDSPVLFCKTSCNLSDRTSFTWYKNGKRFSESSDTNRLLLQSVSSDDTGNYSCAARDQEHLSSPAVALSVRYPPKSVSVSVSPSETVSGDSVTLICSSDSNPPALNFSWFKGGTFLGSGDTYSISNITSESSGNYCCSAENKHGSQSSPAVTVNVMYPPKNVSVSVSPCCEIVSGDSVTLNCSSDSNPPALNFRWFKENETSAVGSGQSFSISSFSSSFSGRFYCKAQNKYGRERSASVYLSLAGGWTAGLYVAAGIGAVLICTCVIVVVIKITRKTRDPGVRGGLSKQENSSAAVADQMSVCDSGAQNDLIYSSIDHKRPRKHQSAGDEDEVQYATVHHRRTENTSVRAEGPSGDVRDLCPAESARSDDSSVIYSSINVA